jgi:4-amino-4-deoxy-L-arabinose transferase-like glycosyltransferase
VVLALFINLARNDVKVKDKKRLLVFLLTLITTQSSTGMVAILAVVLWYSWSRFHNIAVRIISIPAAAALVIFLFVSIPWLQDKIRSESEQDLNILLENSRKYDRTYAPGRFIGLQLGWEDFKNFPIAGYGGNSELRFGFQGGSQVSAINGFANIMGRYGSLGTLLFFYIIFKTGRYVASYFRYSGVFIFPSIILIISFGFGIIEEPLIFTLLLTPIFIKKHEHEH